MLRGERIGLRARHEDDIPVLHAELYDDPVTTARSEARPWRPVTPGADDARLKPDDDPAHVTFSVVALDDAEALIGTATLWGIAREGVTRASAWVMGEWLDEVTLGLLEHEWGARASA